MDPVIWVAVIGAVSSVMAIWLTKRLERTKEANEQAVTKVTETQVVVNTWKDLFAEVKAELANERAIAATFAAANERLETENRELRADRDRCRTEHATQPPT